MQEGLFVVVCGDYVDFPSVSLWPRLESSQGRGRSEGMGRGAHCRANWLQLDTAVLSRAPIFVSMCVCVYIICFSKVAICVFLIFRQYARTHVLTKFGAWDGTAERRSGGDFSSFDQHDATAARRLHISSGLVAFIGLSRIKKATENFHTYYLMMVARLLC